MSRCFVHGLGAVSPAGWGVSALLAAVDRGEPLPLVPLGRPGRLQPLLTRPVPPPPQRPAFLAHPRLRRSGPLAQHLVAAALEALGTDIAGIQAGRSRLGIVACTMVGSVAYSRRFFEEALREPALASPMLFPETVFNAAASHLAAFLSSGSINYTLIGDDGTFLQGLVVAADWLATGLVDGCLVVGVEELDWIVADAARLFHRRSILAGGAGALYLKSMPSRIAELARVTDAFIYASGQTRREAALRVRDQLTAKRSSAAVCLSQQGIRGLDEAEEEAWRGLAPVRWTPKRLLGEAFAASAAWQCVVACQAINEQRAVEVDLSVVGVNEQAIGATFQACVVGDGITG